MDDIEEIGILLGIQNIIEAEIEMDLPARNYNSRDDAFQLADRQFVRMFRLSKQLTEFLIDLVSPYMVQPQRSSALDPSVKVLVALKFFATGSYQPDIGSNIFLSVSQSSVSRAVNEVADILNRPEIFNAWIKLSINEVDLATIRNGFFNMYGFTGVVGAIDCTHVAIVPPKTHDPIYPEHIYVNRKGYHSINVQLVCDSQMKILNANARYPGGTNDMYIWNNSNIKNAMENLYRTGHTGYHLLGDSGYTLRPWLLTPTEIEPPPNTNAFRYNVCHRSTRNVIERCNGLLKMRFRCLLKHRVLHYSPDVASKIINACLVLHNMCLEYNIPDPEADDEIDFGIDNYIANEDNFNIRGRVNPELEAGRRKQRQIINSHFRV